MTRKIIVIFVGLFLGLKIQAKDMECQILDLGVKEQIQSISQNETIIVYDATSPHMGINLDGDLLDTKKSDGVRTFFFSNECDNMIYISFKVKNLKGLQSGEFSHIFGDFKYSDATPFETASRVKCQYIN